MGELFHVHHLLDTRKTLKGTRPKSNNLSITRDGFTFGAISYSHLKNKND